MEQTISAGRRIHKHKASWSDTVTILHCLYLPDQQQNTGSVRLWEPLQQRWMLKHSYPSCTIIMSTVRCVLNCPTAPQLARERKLTNIWWLPKQRPYWSEYEKEGQFLLNRNNQSKQIMMGHESHVACWQQLWLKLKVSAFIVCTIQRIHLHNWFL